MKLHLVAFMIMGVVCVVFITNLPKTNTKTNVYVKSMRAPDVEPVDVEPVDVEPVLEPAFGWKISEPEQVLEKTLVSEPAPREPAPPEPPEPPEPEPPEPAPPEPEPMLEKTLNLEVLSVCLQGERFSKEVVDASFKNKDFWCRKNKVTCNLYDINHKLQHPKWDKLSRLIDILHANTTKWVLWMDCDSIFTGMNPPNIFDQNYDIITSEDKNGVNLGVFIVQSRDSAITLINEMYNERDAVDTYSKHGWKDQEALIRVRKRHNISIKIIPQKVLNSYYMNSDGVQWSEGDWIAHQVYCRRKDCNDNFVRMSQKIFEKSANACQSIKNTLLGKSIMVACSKWSGEFIKRVSGHGWEAQTRVQINDVLTKYQPISTFQAGMHVGGHLIPMAMAFPKLHFIGVDPDVSKCQFVRDMISINAIQNIDVIHGGIDSTQHACALDKSFKNPGMWLIVNGNTLQCYTIDTLAAKFKNIEFVHLDLEGGEYKGILGAVETLTKNHPSVMFENDHLREHSEMIDLLISHGYNKTIEVEHNEVWIATHHNNMERGIREEHVVEPD